MKKSNKNFNKIAVGITLVAAFISSGARPAIFAQKIGDEAKIVRSEKLPNAPGKTLSIIVVNYLPGGKSPKHHHAGSVLAYVLSGAIRSANSATGAMKVYQTGESFFEPAGSEHLISENASQIEPASLLAIFVADDGAQLTTYGDAQTSAVAPPTTPETFVDALNSAFGKQTTQRATHAKGIILLGKFTPSADAKSLSKALHFSQAVPVTVRFSDNTGMPMLPDSAPLASPHGLAIKFHLPDGSETDLVTHSYNGFPAANADETQKFFLAVGLSGAVNPSPSPIEKYMAEHPAAKAFLTTQDPPPVSYATIAYFGVNSFKFTNADGKVTIGRYQIVPQAGKQFLSKEEIAKAAPDYLSDELRQRLPKNPIRFTFRLQLAEPGDKIEDPSIAWSDKNKTIDLGVLEITSIVPDSDAAQRALLFMPGLLPAGIEPADPMIQFRNRTYPVSYDRRHQQ